MPRATRSHIERVSISFFESRSMPARDRRSFKPRAPSPLAFPILGKMDEATGDGCIKTATASPHQPTHKSVGAYHDRRASSVSGNTATFIEPQILSYKEVQELRIFPPPNQRSHVHFTRRNSEITTPSTRNVSPLTTMTLGAIPLPFWPRDPDRTMFTRTRRTTCSKALQCTQCFDPLRSCWRRSERM